MRGDPMQPVRLPDVPGVVWTIAWAFAGARLPGPVRTAVAVASLPMWVLMLLCLPGLHYGVGRRVVARLTPCTPRAAARTAVRFALFLLVVAALTAGLIAGAANASLAGAVVVVVVCVGVLATFTALLISQIAVVTATSRTPAAAGATARDKAADQRRWKDADWQVDCVASRLPTGGLALVHEHVRGFVPPAPPSASTPPPPATPTCTPATAYAPCPPSPYAWSPATAAHNRRAAPPTPR